MRLFSLSDMFLNPSFKIIANVARPIVSTKKKNYILIKISNHQELGLYMKNIF